MVKGQCCEVILGCSNKYSAEDTANKTAAFKTGCHFQPDIVHLHRNCTGGLTIPLEFFWSDLDILLERFWFRYN